ncbi:MAG: alpha/beta hydrolase [Bacteroidota bacterium]|nr:alpha/beta hydrolase [Bacteroidota bacterium]MDP4204893.1 alpha/beta hydrolase [Bacteroidota bacterium]
MRKFKDVWILWVGLLIIAYLSGPKLSAPLLDEPLPVVSCNLNQLENYVAQKESKFSIKPDNQSRIIWANNLQHQQTEYVLLYLHGFSASWFEGADINLDYAKKFGMNAYFPRLYGHGLMNAQDALLDMKPDSLYNSALEALVIASKLGKKVIIMSTSTGGTLSLKIAAEHPELVHSLILLSPNAQIKNKCASFLTMPWGLQTVRLFTHSKFRDTGEKDTLTNKYWYTKYRLEGVGYLQQLIDNAMNKKVLSKVTCPVFMGYYYKDDNKQDQVVEVKGMLKMFDKIATPDAQKVKVAFPDAGCHIIGNSHYSKSFSQVENEVFKFTTNILKINPVVK